MHAHTTRLFALGLLFLLNSVATSFDECNTVLFTRTIPSNALLVDARYRELDYRQDIWYESTFFTGPNWTRVGRNWHHPGENTPSVRCFTAPRDGDVTIIGRVFKLHQAGDGIRATIRHNERDIWSTEIAGKDGDGATHQLGLSVAAGDRIRFVVHKLGGISCDTTGWDPCIRFHDDNSEYLASAAFDAHRQGSDGWRYEMEVSESIDEGHPTIHAWDSHLGIRQFILQPNEPVVISDREVFPLLVVADAQDQGGIALAWPSTRSWRFVAKLNEQQEIELTWYGHPEATADELVLSQDYSGDHIYGWKEADQWLLQSSLSAIRKRMDETVPDDSILLALRAMIQADWRRQDGIDGSPASYTVAVSQQQQRMADLLAAAQAARGSASLEDATRQFAELQRKTAALRPDDSFRHPWLELRRLKRRVLLADPRLDFGPLLVCKRVPPSWSHLVAQYFGWRQRPGGGIYVIPEPGRSLEARDILGSQLPPGSVLEPRLSYDGKRILFAFVACDESVPEPSALPVNEAGDNHRYFHLYEINVDGSGLRQLTDGPYDDMMGEYLPDGDIVFCSTRRRGYSRCFGPEYSYRWHTYTLHRMRADGTRIRTLSFNDVSEWFPSVSRSGHILHARWDYIDRDAVTHQNLWAIRPDGSNSTAVWGNASPKPHCTFQAKAIPNSNKIVFIAAAHHAITAGPVCVLDPAIDVNSLHAVTRVTPLPFPEAEGGLDEWYASPWPLAEDLFLVAYSPYHLRFQGEHMRDPNPDNGLGVYVLDGKGNRELLYRDPEIGTTTPIPLVARPRPPVVPSAPRTQKQETGTMAVADVYQGLGGVPRGTIERLRIVQLFPKTTWLANQPRVGVAGEENGRAILGTVPVESDGSAYFEVPAGRPVLFQALDTNGMAYQTMRSLTFVQPGEQTFCVGCHEHRMSSPSTGSSLPLALQRPPSPIDPGELGGRPFGFVEMIQPILDEHCVRCHDGTAKSAAPNLTATPHQGFTQSYVSLCGTPDQWRSLSYDLDQAAAHHVPRFVQRNQVQLTPPGGAFGARGSRLMKLLRDGHEQVELSAEDLERIAAWIDLNAIFYGVYDPENRDRQLAGQRVEMPEIQ